MSWVAERAQLASAIRAAVAGARGHVPVILIDGPSGAGKSSLADHLLRSWPAEGSPRLVRMDDLYPGWDGLDAGSDALARDLLEPLRRRGAGHWQRWDWKNRRIAERVLVTGRDPLLVEGCGTLARANVACADLALWLNADDGLRMRRALARDGETFAQQWERWQAQFVRYTEREQPRDSAALSLDVTAWPLGTVHPVSHGTTLVP